MTPPLQPPSSSGALASAEALTVSQLRHRCDPSGRFPPRSINGLVEQQLTALASQARAFRTAAEAPKR